MRLATFTRGGQPRAGLVWHGQLLELAELAQARGIRLPEISSVDELLRLGQPAWGRVNELAAALKQQGVPRGVRACALGGVRLEAPILRPQKIVAIGLNYRDHAAEAGMAIPAAPILFAKFPNSITGPYDPLVLPRDAPDVDFEGELGVVIASRCKHIEPDQALGCVAGYLVTNDVSARRWQFADQQWTRGKSADTFAPMGPWLTTADEVADPQQLKLQTRLNGRLMQDSSTREMIFTVAQLISYVSSSLTLEPGDVIATGTPAGVGFSRRPPVFLRPGDLVEVEIEGLGRIANPVAAEPAGAR